MGNLYLQENIKIHSARIFSLCRKMLKRKTSPMCPNCGREILAFTATGCIYCGWPLIIDSPKQATKDKIADWILKFRKMLKRKTSPKCPNCGRETLADTATECIYCRWPLTAVYPTRFTKHKIANWILIILGFLVIIFALVLYENILNVDHSLIWSIITFVVGYFMSIWGLTREKGANLFSFTRKDVKRIPIFIYFGVIFSIIGAVLIIYFLQLAAKKAGTNFDLAMYSAAVGSLVLVGGFIDNTDELQAKTLKSIGKWFLIASIASALFKLAWDALLGETAGSVGYRILYIFSLMALILSVYSFAYAICLLLPTIFTIDKPKKLSQ
jgi:ribosomal protein L37E